ncbi:MAG: hypothetical protein K6C32_05185 [Bacilli bacterium]|nr:hypothetical protein [Bacilli bacterium]
MKKIFPTLTICISLLFSSCNKDLRQNYELYFRVEDIAQKDDVIKEFKSRLKELHIGYGVKSLEDNVIKVSIKIPGTEVLDILTTYLIANKPLTMTNAHDTSMYPIDAGEKGAYVKIDGRYPYLKLPINHQNTIYEKMLDETINDIQTNNENYVEYRTDSEGEESENLNVYCFYLWFDYDPEVCTFDNHRSGDSDCDRQLVMTIPVQEDHKTASEFDIPFNYDRDGDGWADDKDIMINQIYMYSIAGLINIKENNYEIYPIGNPNEE